MALVKEDRCEESRKYMGFALHQVNTSTASIITPKVCCFFFRVTMSDLHGLQAKLALEALEVPVG